MLMDGRDEQAKQEIWDILTSSGPTVGSSAARGRNTIEEFRESIARRQAANDG